MVAYIDNILFAIVLIIGIGFFVKNIRILIRNIHLGKAINRSDQPKKRWKHMVMVALGQSKMVKRPIAGILHILVYLGFIIINIEILEIILDGLLGTHRIFSFIGKPYYLLIGFFEILGFLVLISVIIFWVRRMILKIPRFWTTEMKGFPKKDALYILYFEMVLMTLFLTMNATDIPFQQVNSGNIISQFIAPIFNEVNPYYLHLIERTCWWLHIVGVLIFLNYLYYSKHLHILLAFPNTWHAKLTPKGQLTNDPNVTKEVKIMLDPNADPYAMPEEDNSEEIPEKFGASDITDLSWVQLMNAYTCTECGRCTSSCPAHLTGKLLSPRNIMMKTRDRIEEVGKNISKNGSFKEDGKQLLNDYITPEELWACTTCNACVEECPIDIDPLSIIIEMRRYLVMEQSSAPTELNNMMSNIENNGAPWQYSQMDRLNWKDEE